MATEKNFQATTPAPPSGGRNSIWQVETTSSSVDAVTGQPVFKASCYQTDMVGDTGSGGADGLAPAPPAGSAAAGKFLKADATWEVPTAAGGVSVKTTNYTAIAGDVGTLLSFNDASAVTLTLPATPPSANWWIAVQDVGAGALTISPNGKNLDTSASSLVIQQNNGVLIYSDGTNYFTERGISPSLAGLATIAGVQDETYTYSADTGTAINIFAQTLTPTPSVTAGLSGKFKAAHACTGASTFTVAGTTAPLVKNGSQNLVTGDIVVGQIVAWTYDGTNFQTGGIGLSAGGNVQASLRGTGSNFFYSSPEVIPWPTGTIAGDFAVICIGGGPSTTTTPSGWTLNNTSNGVVGNGSGVTISKILNASDISAGSVTVTLSAVFAASYAIATFVGPTGGIREVDATNGGAGGTITTSSAVQASDFALYFGCAMSVTHNAGTYSFNRGTLQQSPNDSFYTNGAFNSEALSVAGSYTAIGSTTAFGVDGYIAGVIIEAGLGGAGSVTSVGLTVPSRQTVSGSPVTGAGILAITDNTQSANTFFRGPTSGSPAAPTFGAIVPADMPTFVASGATHAAGAVPDPGATAGTLRYLREDASWAAPSGSGGVSSLTTTGSSGAATLSGGVLNIPVYTGGATPTIRGTGIQASSAASFTVSWPSGTVAGDLAIIFFAGGFDLSAIPTGWTQIDFTTGTNWEGATFYRFLSNADITAGHIVLTPTGTFDAAIAIATIEGPNNAIRTSVVARNGSGSTSITLNTDGSPQTNDLALYFGSNRGASTNTVSLGSNLQQANDGSAGSGCLFGGSPAAAGGVSPVFSYSSAGTGNYQIAVVVKGV